MERKARIKARITSKCQITIPKELRDELGLKPGDDIEFVHENGHYKVGRTYDRSGLDAYKGYLKELEGVDVDELIEEMRGR